MSFQWGFAREIDGFRLTWWEQGVGIQPVERGKSFGTTMIDALIEKQLGGHVTRIWAPGGPIFVIEAPGG